MHLDAGPGDGELYFDPATQPGRRGKATLRLKSFLKLEEEGDTRTYTLRTDPSLIALDLLRGGMAKPGLLQEVDTPRIQGQWAEQDGRCAAPFVYGALAWVGRTHSQDASALPLWSSQGMEIEPATIPDLLLWRAAQPAHLQSPLEAVIAQAIRATDAARLADMPARWLRHISLAEDFLQRLGKDQGMAYLALNAADLGDGLASTASVTNCSIASCAWAWAGSYQRCLRSGFPTRRHDRTRSTACCATKPCRPSAR